MPHSLSPAETARARWSWPSSGFSLIELLVVIAIAAILLGVAVPNFSSFVVNNRLSSASNEFAASLQLARSEAIRLRTGVGISILPATAAGSGDYGAGWQMFVDADGNGAFTSGERVLREGQAAPAPMTLRGSRPAYGNAVVFNANGGVVNGAGAFVICYGPALTEGGQSRARVIAINGSGRVRVGTDANGNQIPEDDSGEITTCTP
jgi:type IV fimbrial biogenesis protein FimT